MSEALLQAVYAAPEEDAPRAVLADWLLLNGEPELGEFIQLQLRTAADKKPKPREKELFVQGSKRFWPDHPWTISTGGNGAFKEIDRGFPAVVSASFATTKKRSALARNAGWATGREVYAMGDGLVGVELPPMPSTLRSSRHPR